MERTDKDLLFKIISINPHLSKLYKRHKELEKEVNKYNRYVSCSSFALRRQREIKREKLKTRDQIQEILNSYKNEEFSDLRKKVG